MFGDKLLQVPVVDVAGEEVATLIERFGMGSQILDYSEHLRHSATLYNDILMSSGFIVVVPVTRARMMQGVALESEPDNLPTDPDVNISRLLTTIYHYKQKTRTKKVKGICVVFTKYDQLHQITTVKGMDLTSPQGIRKFMLAFFPETYRTLDFYGLEKVIFLPVWVDLDEEAENYPFKILPDPSRFNRPSYSRSNYELLVSWMEKTFT